MSEFDLTIRAAMQDDSLFNDILEIARSKGQSLQEFIVCLCRRETRPLEQEPILHDKESLQRLADEFFAEADRDPVAFAHRLCEGSDWIESLEPWELRELCGFGGDLYP